MGLTFGGRVIIKGFLDNGEVGEEGVKDFLQFGILVAVEKFASHGHHERNLEVDLGGVNTVEGAVKLGVGKSAIDAIVHAGFVS